MSVRVHNLKTNHSQHYERDSNAADFQFLLIYHPLALPIRRG
ncbi:hypothetical protein RRSWK_01855 [Rhodopirellula sp. SWK7]|nr:hypothetical protein RRSWK_01855 [Rhodopirellula sp. SWK7]